MSGISILIVDDDESLRGRLAKAFESRGFEARTAAGLGDGLKLAKEESPELALVDLRMEDGGGLELVRELKAIDPATNVVVLTGYGSIATAVEAVKLGATHYLTKPADVDEILAAFARSGADISIDSETKEVPSLARVEWEHINKVLNDCGGNISRTAKLLGLHRRSLQRKLAKFPASR